MTQTSNPAVTLTEFFPNPKERQDRSGGGWWRRLLKSVSVLNATELYT